MNLTEIKNKIGISQLNLNTALDKNDKATDWMRHWEDSTRTAVTIHKDLVAEIKANPTIATLGLQTETRTGEQGSYTAHRIVRFKPAEETM